ncbi:lytic transglycosylase domain-containing protein [Methylophilus sp. DW102]|uniref:lytic transglycosylase domain-containing protein n=1 Tax=Methylophilus sp. DW102 TaxID=3095607 RepID=UPI003087FA1E|nr:lytic transglycosylase domain-containing protein [Methylophilus sp. DW102]
MPNLVVKLRVFFVLTLLVCIPAHATEAIEYLAGKIVLDPSDDTEIVISNTGGSDTETEPVIADDGRKTLTGSRWSTAQLPYQAEVQAAAQVTQLEPALIHAVIATESGYNAKATSPKGAYGLMQVMPATAKTLTPTPVRAWSASQQILWGSRYLKQLMDLFEGDVVLALAAYNAGPQAVKSHQRTVPPYAETQQYVPKVLRYYQVFKSKLIQPLH